MEEKQFYPAIERPWMEYYDLDDFIEMPNQTIFDFIWSRNRNNPDNTALNYFGKKISYQELFRNILNSARLLQSIGVNEDDRILYLLPNFPETVYFLYGSSILGAVSDYLDPRPDSLDMNVSAQKLLSIIKDEKIKFLVVFDQVYLGMIKPIEKELKDLGIKDIIIISADDSFKGKEKLELLNTQRKLNGAKSVTEAIKNSGKKESILKKAIEESPLNIIRYGDVDFDELNKEIKKLNKIPYKPDRIEAIVHTSGTTRNRPKPIPITNDNMNHYTEQIFHANMPMKDYDKALEILPFFAAFGIVNVVHALLARRNELIMIPEFSPQDLGKLLNFYEPQTLIGPPAWFSFLTASPDLKDKDLSYLRMLTYGGDAMEPEDETAINEFLKEKGAKITLTKGHGLSETCGCASYAIGDYNYLDSFGIPMPFTVYAIVDPETKEMIPFTENDEYIEGEIVISGPTVTHSEFDGEKLFDTIEFEGDTYILTGDVGRMHRDGHLKFLSRDDRTFTRIDGYKVKPYEIEPIIKAHPKVENVIISDYYDPDIMGKMIMAYIVPKEKPESREDEIGLTKEIIQDVFINNPDISSRQMPKKFKYLDTVPFTKNGKVDYLSLRKRELDDSEISIDSKETNLSISNINIH